MIKPTYTQKISLYLINNKFYFSFRNITLIKSKYQSAAQFLINRILYGCHLVGRHWVVQLTVNPLIVDNLHNDHDVHAQLHGPAHYELDRLGLDDEVQGFQEVTREPREDHEET